MRRDLLPDESIGTDSIGRRCVRVDAKARVRRLLTPDEHTGCLLWTGTTTRSGGYGTIWHNGKHRRVSRLVWEWERGPIPPGLMVCHHCDTPRCANIDHLFIGTQRENMMDASRKGRIKTGDAHPMRTGKRVVERGDTHWSRTKPHLRVVGMRHGSSVLTDDDVRVIRNAHALGARVMVMARYFRVAHSAIIRIIRGRGWVHVQDGPNAVPDVLLHNQVPAAVATMRGEP